MADFRISKPTLDDTAATDTSSAWSINALLRLLANRLGGTGSVRVTDGVDEALVTSGKGLHVNLRNDAGTEVAPLTEADFDTKTGSLTETAPTTDTESSGLNGRLQRVAQRLTSLIALLPAALVSGRLDVNLGAAPAAVVLGAGTAEIGKLAAGSAAIGKLAANSGVDIGDVDVTSLPRAATATLTNVSDTATSTTVLAANANRLGATVHNDSTASLYLKFGATASATSFTIKIEPDGYYEVPFGYTGIIDGIWTADASGAARVTELTA